MPHPIAAGNRLEGRDCQGWRFVPSRSDATARAPLTGLSWRATSSEADEATGVRPGMAGLLAARRPAMALMRAG